MIVTRRKSVLKEAKHVDSVMAGEERKAKLQKKN